MNKKIITIIGMVIIAAGLAYFASAAGVVLFGGDNHHDSSDGLVLDLSLAQDNYTSGTKTFTDNSGGGNNGVSVNAATFVPDNYGKSTGAMSFDGTDMIEAPSSSFNLPGYTFSFWIKTNTATTTVFSTYWNTPRTAIYITAGKVQFNIRGSNGVTVPDLYVTSTTSITDDNWHFITAKKDDDNIKIYVDGSLEGTTSGASNLNANARATFGLGASGGYRTVYSPAFIGDLSEFRRYNRALSDAEVLALYNSYKPKAVASSIQKGLVGYWPLDGDNYNATTARVGDETPYGNHGQNYGATLTTDRNGQSNGAMSFEDSSNTQILIPSRIFSDSEAWTFSHWIYWDGQPDRYVFYAGSGGTNQNLLLRINSNSFAFRSSTTGYSYFNANSSNSIIGKWSQLTWVADGNGKLSLYIDDTFFQELFGVGTAINFSFLGRGYGYRSYASFPNDTYFLKGDLSDVRIYNRALSVDEVSMLYNSNKPKVVSDSLQKDLVLDMPLTSTYTKTVTAGSQIMVDKTPYGNNGQNSGATVGADSTSFDGVNNYVNLGAPTSLNINDSITISTWVNFSSLSGNGSVASIYEKGSQSANNHYWLGWARSGSWFFELGNGTTRYALGYTSTPVLGRWYHFVSTYSNIDEYFRIYLDGQEVSSSYRAGFGHIGGTTSGSLIGQYKSIGSHAFTGSISGVKIYNRALSDTEVKSLFEKGRQ